MRVFFSLSSLQLAQSAGLQSAGQGKEQRYPQDADGDVRGRKKADRRSARVKRERREPADANEAFHHSKLMMMMPINTHTNAMKITLAIERESGKVIHWTERLGGHTQIRVQCTSFLMKPNQLHGCCCELYTI